MTDVGSWMRRERVWVSLVLVLATIVFLGDLFVQGRVFLARDTLFDMLPMRLFAASSLASGHFPFWCPEVGTGKPFLGDPMSAALYPLHVVFHIFSPAFALKMTWLAHLCIAGAGMYWLMREFTVGCVAAICSAFGFMFGTWYIAQVEFIVNLTTAAWIPFPLAVLARFQRALPSEAKCWWAEAWRQRRLGAVLALVFACQFTANYPEWMIYPMVAIAGLVLVAFLQQRCAVAVAAQVAFLLVSGLLAIGLVLPQLGPILEFIPQSERATTFDNRFEMASPGLSHAATVLFPFLHGWPGYPDCFWAKDVYEYWVAAFYIGTLGVFAAPFAIMIGFQDKLPQDRRWLAATLGFGLIVIGIILSAGHNTPVYAWVHQNVPLMKAFRFPAKFLVLVVLGLLLVGGVGLDALRQTVWSRRQRRLVYAVVTCEALLGLSLVLVAMYVSGDSAKLRALLGVPASVPEHRISSLSKQLLLDLAFCTLALGLVAVHGLVPWFKKTPMLAIAPPVLVFVNLFCVSRQMLPTAADSIANKSENLAIAKLVGGQPEYRVHSMYWDIQQYFYANADVSLFEWGRQAGVADSWLPYGISQTWCGGPKLKNVNQMLGFLSQPGRPAHAEIVADVLGIRWLLVGDDWQQVLAGGLARSLHVVSRPGAVPRISLAAKWQRVGSDRQVWELMASGNLTKDRPFVEPVVLERGCERVRDVPSDSHIANGGEVCDINYRNNSVTATVDVDDASLLVLSDTWYPGWRARLDEFEVPIHRVNALFRGVFVPPGRHLIRFEYQPNGIAIYVTGCMLTLVIIARILGPCILAKLSLPFQVFTS